jgi:hypothetical protein
MAQHDQFVGQRWYRSPPKRYAKTGTARSWTNGGADAKPRSRWCVRSCCVCVTTLCCLQRRRDIDRCSRTCLRNGQLSASGHTVAEAPSQQSTEGTTTCAYHWLYRSCVQMQVCSNVVLFGLPCLAWWLIETWCGARWGARGCMAPLSWSAFKCSPSAGYGRTCRSEPRPADPL